MDAFEITQRHYDIIIKQVKDNFPYESGGFIGGKGNVISAIYPVFNQDISNKTDIFSVYTTDIERAHLFFNKHGLEYFGTYHSHPKGEAVPSEQDLSHIQKYLFIISLRNFEKPDFAAYITTGYKQAERIPLDIVSDSQFSVKDIKGDGTQTKTLDGFYIPTEMPDHSDEEKLNEQVQNVFNKKAQYKKDVRKKDIEGGDFSTLA